MTRLRAWRLDKGLTLDEVAGLTGMSKTMLSRAETGGRQFSPMTRVKVARRLGVRIDTLFDVDPITDDAA
jgi:transcriptional regulator with XRE-family HTH domain